MRVTLTSSVKVSVYQFTLLIHRHKIPVNIITILIVKFLRKISQLREISSIV